MFELNNSTPFAADMVLFPNEQGVDTLYLMVKASFKIGQKWVLADEQLPPTVKDEYWGEPNDTSIKYASDLHLSKPATDIIMIGDAHSANGQQVKELDVSLSVGQVNKTIRVFGDRQWQEGRITPPTPFQTMPLIYENAYGGQYLDNQQVHTLEEKNPVGCGFSGKRSVSEMNNIKLPNLEDPKALIRQVSDQPIPACFAYSSATWQPRVNYAGTYDDTWQTQRAPYLPLDFDNRFFNLAHTDLIYPGYLQGGEAVHITHMHPHGTLQFHLPRIQFISHIEQSNKQTTLPPFNLETLLLEPNQLQLSMVWRSAISCDKKALKMSDITIALLR